MLPRRFARLSVGLWLAAFLAGAPKASAQDMLQTGQVSMQDAYVPSPSSKATSKLLLPEGTLQAGGDLVVVTSKPVIDRPSFAGRQLDFSDAALLRLRLRYSFGWAELFTATELFAKQPEYLREPIWQATRLGTRIPFGKIYAGSVTGAVGQQQGYPGRWWQVEPRLLAKPELTDHVFAELELGTSHRWFAAPPEVIAPVPSYALQEIVASTELAAGDGGSGGWIGFEYRVPFSAHPRPNEAPEQPAHLDSGVQLSFQVGGSASTDDGWEFFAYYSIVDRGDLLDRDTQLPVFSAGFDQQQLCLGVQYLFGRKRRYSEYE